MKMLVTIICLFTLTIQPSWGMLIKDIVIKGTVSKVEKDFYEVKDAYGQKHRPKREKVIAVKPGKIQIGSKVSFVHKLELKRAPLKLELNKKVKLKDEDKQKLHSATFKFMAMVHDKMKRHDKNYTPHEGALEKKTSWHEAVPSLEEMLNFLISPAYCENEANCLFAGWPSIESSTGSCLVPWSTDSRSARSGYRACGGGDNVFRCNPKLFGSGVALASGQSESFRDSAAVEPFPNASVSVFPTDDPQNGFCVKTQNSDNVLFNCLQAAQQNMPNLMRNFDTNYFNTQIAPLVHAYCGGNVCPEGSYKNGNECVESCPGGSTLSEGECRSTTSAATVVPPVEEATSDSTSAEAPVVDINRQAECEYMAKQIETINFHRTPDRTRCAIWRNGAVEGNDSCRSLELVCQRGGHQFKGYLNQEQYTHLKVRHGGREVNISTLASQDEGLWLNTELNETNGVDLNFSGDMKLYQRPCLNAEESAEEVVNPSFDQCQSAEIAGAPVVSPLGELNNARASRGTSERDCQGDYCVMQGTCLVQTETAGEGETSSSRRAEEPNFFYNVQLVCRCSQEELNGTASPPLSFQRCQAEALDQFTPRTDGELDVRGDGTSGAGRN
jgi:hypothetical protein